MTERFEGAPAAQPEHGEGAFAAETFTVPVPVMAEKWEMPEGATDEKQQAVEFHNAPIDRRAALVEEMMNQGTGSEQYGELWDDVAERLTRGRRAGETPLGRYLGEAQNVREVTALVKELRGGTAWNDVLAREVHESTEESISERRLRAVEVVSSVMNDSVREWKQPDGGVDRKEWEHLATDQRASALLRVSEIVNLEAKGARLRHGVLSGAEQQYSEEYTRRLQRLWATDDVPEVFRDRANDTVREWRVQQIQASDAAVGRGDTAPAEPALERPAAAGPVGAGTVEPASVSSDREPPASAAEEPRPRPRQPEAGARPELKSREAVFGREGISREDLRGIRHQLFTQLEAGTTESALSAARQLAHLKRARIQLSAEGRQRVFDRLLKHRQELGQLDARQQARYLTYLKYLGAIDEVSEAEKQRLELAIVDRTSHDRLADLDQLCMNAKYLGVREDFASVRPYLERDMAQRLEQPAGEEGVAFARARRKYLGLAHGLPEEHLRVEDRVDRRLMQYGQRGRWDRFVRLRNAVDYVRGGASVDEPVRVAVAQHVATERARGRERGDWEAHTAYVADAATLSRQAEAARGEPAVQRAADSDIAQFLAGLELRGDLESAEQHMREWLAAREQAERPRKAREAARHTQPEPAAEPVEAAAVEAAARPRQATYKAAMAEHKREAAQREPQAETGGLLARWRRWWRRRFGGEEPQSDIDTQTESEETRRAA